MRGWLVVFVLLASCSAGSAATTETTAVTPTSTVGSLACWQSPATATGGAVTWEDVTDSYGLVTPLTGMHGHAAAWGDVNQDNQADLVVGTFANRSLSSYLARGAPGPSPDVLLLGGNPFEPVFGFSEALVRTSASVFADLDQDGDLDLVLIRNSGPRDGSDQPSQLFENRAGQLVAVAHLPLPENFSGRSIAVADFDGDADLDLAIAEDRFGESGARLLTNQGGFDFVDSTAASGIPPKTYGLGVVASDLTGDLAPDLFFSGAQLLFVNKGDGTFDAVDSEVFAWSPSGEEDDVAGVAVGDLDRNGWPDLVIGHHFNSTLNQDRATPVRLFLHQGLDSQGHPVFVESTQESGLIALPTKAPHVEVVDLDNDGWPDLLTTASSNDGESIAVFRNLGLVGGVPRFESPVGLGNDQYWVAGPTADFDRDGRLDVFLVEWEPALPSRLLRNTSPSGHWLEVSLAGPMKGVGTTVAIYSSGNLGQPSGLLGRQEIGVGVGYGAGRQPIAHFGLGETDSVDLIIVTPDGQVNEVLGISADQHMRWPNGC